MAEPSNPRRRWFRFSLRTLLIAMAVLSAVVGYAFHERQIVKERGSAFRAAINEPGGASWLDVPLVGTRYFIRRYFGDAHFVLIWIEGPVQESTLARLRNAFPEADIDTDHNVMNRHADEFAPQGHQSPVGSWMDSPRYAAFAPATQN